LTSVGSRRVSTNHIIGNRAPIIFLTLARAEDGQINFLQDDGLTSSRGCGSPTGSRHRETFHRGVHHIPGKADGLDRSRVGERSLQSQQGDVIVLRFLVVGGVLNHLRHGDDHVCGLRTRGDVMIRAVDVECGTSWDGGGAMGGSKDPVIVDNRGSTEGTHVRLVKVTPPRELIQAGQRSSHNPGRLVPNPTLATGVCRRRRGCWCRLWLGLDCLRSS